MADQSIRSKMPKMLVQQLSCQTPLKFQVFKHRGGRFFPERLLSPCTWVVSTRNLYRARVWHESRRTTRPFKGVPKMATSVNGAS